MVKYHRWLADGITGSIGPGGFPLLGGGFGGVLGLAGAGGGAGGGFALRPGGGGLRGLTFATAFVGLVSLTLGLFGRLGGSFEGWR